jgi:hypothetical protein
MRRWEVLIFVHVWKWHINRPLGARTTTAPFLHETWLGPLCFRLWRNPKSVSSMSRWLIIVWDKL